MSSVWERGTKLVGNLQLEYTTYLALFASFYNLIEVYNEWDSGLVHTPNGLGSDFIIITSSSRI